MDSEAKGGRHIGKSGHQRPLSILAGVLVCSGPLSGHSLAEPEATRPVEGRNGVPSASKAVTKPTWQAAGAADQARGPHGRADRVLGRADRQRK